MSSSSDSSSAAEKKKKRAKEKKQKKEKAPKKPKKEKRVKKAESGSEDDARRRKQQRRNVSPADAAPNFGASGLLDGDDDGEAPAPPPSVGARLGPTRGDMLAGRSRSRDAGPRPGPGGGFGDSAGGGFDDGGKGKGKGKGKGGGGEGVGGEDAAPKEEPTFEPSGLLGLEDNSKNGIPLKFTMPAEARYPHVKWRIYIFTKQQEKPKIVHIHRMMGILFGKDRRVADIPTDHPTCSKQHAVLHHRMASTGEVKPYIMDLESVNGTFLNGERLQPARYYEMRESDVLKFGMSSREFVLLHAGSANHIAIDPKHLRSPSE